jgi:hypothetical protein
MLMLKLIMLLLMMLPLMMLLLLMLMLMLPLLMLHLMMLLLLYHAARVSRANDTDIWDVLREIVFHHEVTPWKPYKRLFIATVRKWYDESDFAHTDCDDLCMEWGGLLTCDKRLRVRLEVDAYRLVRNIEYDTVEPRSLEYVIGSAVLWEEFNEDGICVLPHYHVPFNHMKINILASDIVHAPFPDDWLEWSFYVSVCESTFGRVEIVTKDQLPAGVIGRVTYALNQRHFGWWIY